MFLAQNVKKFLKVNLQKQEDTKVPKSIDYLENDNIFQLSEDMSADPSFAFLTGNSWYSALYDDKSSNE